MLNIVLNVTTSWYSIFTNSNFVFLFIIFLVICLFYILKSSSNINFFFNVLTFIILLIVFLFKINLGAYAGFLFLCETTSLFSLFIILSKLVNNELYNYKLNTQHICISFFVISFLIIYLFKIFGSLENFNTFNDFFIHELLNSNDFWSVANILFNNTYNIYWFITTFLILITLLLIFCINSLKVNKIKSLNQPDNLFSYLTKLLFQENNNVSFKTKILINFFKKVC